MSTWIRNRKFRYALCFAVLALSLLLLGAGRRNGESKTRSRRAVNISVCRAACERLLPAVPADERAAWNDLVRKSPELALRIGCVNLHEIGR